MFNLRHKRTTRDRQSGLVFRWRLPVSSHLGFFAAVGLVGLISVGLAAVVRVRVAGPPRLPEQRGSLILVPQGKEWRALEMLALEAGPMPRGEDLAHEPAVRSLVERSLSDATPPGYAYQPELRPVAVEFPGVKIPGGVPSTPGVLPPLPLAGHTPPRPPAPDPLRPRVLAKGGILVTIPEVPAPAGLTRGDRYVLGYDSSGRVVRVIPLSTAEAPADGSAEQWLRQVILEGGAKEGGWAAVEISSGL